MSEENKNTAEAVEETALPRDVEEEAVQTETLAEEQPAEESAADARERELLAQIEQLTSEKEENYNKFVRAQADLQNFRARTNKEKEQLLAYSSQRVIEALLPAMDNFERALAASKDSQEAGSLIQGVEMVFRQLQQVLEQEGVTTLPGVGEPFDPNMHQAVMQEENSDYESGIIIEEFQKGYKLKDRVIRPSMVKVSS
ncbi:nucleotide exchange factor GrpE [Aneurinibacillus tyrosinisolvens]|uniref:nucleotide exchange factor GrpE n=1 Tax=Aneurinibacillus tyrosinisolvens TaxID=1443435 RepID=UPI00063F99E6|nr:nucleotide exchange factor GrpE [Aneurinibacillus tyrosinisolvens]